MPEVTNLSLEEIQSFGSPNPHGSADTQEQE
jgi:hypothetical protein